MNLSTIYKPVDINKLFKGVFCLFSVQTGRLFVEAVHKLEPRRPWSWLLISASYMAGGQMVGPLQGIFLLGLLSHLSI
jgi:hypothetical protein